MFQRLQTVNSFTGLSLEFLDFSHILCFESFRCIAAGNDALVWSNVLIFICRVRAIFWLFTGITLYITGWLQTLHFQCCLGLAFGKWLSSAPRELQKRFNVETFNKVVSIRQRIKCELKSHQGEQEISATRLICRHETRKNCTRRQGRMLAHWYSWFHGNGNCLREILRWIEYS